MRILITGSRDWPDDGSVDAAICDVIVDHSTETEFVVVQGGCPTGADSQAVAALTRISALTSRGDRSVVLETHFADWDEYGKRAGLVRNQEMVDAGADVCLAFIGPCRKHSGSHGSHGASHTADAARTAGIPVYEHVRTY